MRNLEWTMGAPEKLEPGMLIRWQDGRCELIGSNVDPEVIGCVAAWILGWAWVIKPHELEWAADMAGKHAKGRPEQ